MQGVSRILSPFRNEFSKIQYYRSINVRFYLLYNNTTPFELFVCFVALHPKSTPMDMLGRSVHLTTLFPGQALTSS